jgi:hypothetical protein
MKKLLFILTIFFAIQLSAFAVSREAKLLSTMQSQVKADLGNKLHILIMTWDDDNPNREPLLVLTTDKNNNPKYVAGIYKRGDFSPIVRGEEVTKDNRQLFTPANLSSPYVIKRQMGFDIIKIHLHGKLFKNKKTKLTIDVLKNALTGSRLKIDFFVGVENDQWIATVDKKLIKSIFFKNNRVFGSSVGVGEMIFNKFPHDFK